MKERPTVSLILELVFWMKKPWWFQTKVFTSYYVQYYEMIVWELCQRLDDELALYMIEEVIRRRMIENVALRIKVERKYYNHSLKDLTHKLLRLSPERSVKLAIDRAAS